MTLFSSPPRHLRPFSHVIVALITGSPLRAESWSLDPAVVFALEHSPDARLARTRAEGTQALVAQAGAAWLPQVSVSGRYIDTNSPMTAFASILNQRAFNFGFDFNRPGHVDNLNATGTVAYNLYSGGCATVGRTADHADAAERLAVSPRAVEQAEESASLSRARFEKESLLTADLIGVESRLIEARLRRTVAAADEHLAVVELHRALGLTPPPESKM